jgi:cytochrome c553
VIKKSSFFNLTVQALLAITSISLVSSAAAAAGSADAGKEKAVTCVACHGADGNSANPQWPSLAAQNEVYMTRTLMAFQLPLGDNGKVIEGGRYDPVMTSQAIALTPEDMADIGAYFTTQKMAGKVSNPSLVGSGERLYRGGNMEASVSACIACHGPNGRGNAPAGYPSIAGQHAVYTAKQLQDYRSGARKSDPSGMMRSITERLTYDEINAVASYIQGLR